MLAPYGRNKARTFLDIIRRIDNWPTAAAMRIRPHRPGLRLLNFRSGLNVVCRAGSGDWDVLHEVMFAGSYAPAMDHIKASTAPVVLDLGGNIGLFSLLAASQRTDVTVHAYEPGPPNFRLFEMNRWANPELAKRILLHTEAVGGANANVDWFFDEQNPGGSSLYGTSGQSFPVTIRSFADVVTELGQPVDLAKIDIEGAEFDLLRHTPAEVWQRVRSISLELHDDPRKEMTHQAFFESLKKLGYSIQQETVCTYFLRRG